MKISILYVSCTGNTEKMAAYIKEGLLSAGDLDVKLMKLNGDEPLDAGFITDSRAVIVGTPAYAAAMSWELKKWFDTDRSVKLAGKLGGAFATARYVHGGGDMAVQDTIHHLLCKGIGDLFLG